MKPIYVVAYDDRDAFRVVAQVQALGLKEARRIQKKHSYGCEIYKLVKIK